MAWKPKTFFGNYVRGLANFFTMGLIPGLNKGDNTIWQNLLGRYAGTGLTQSEQEANQFSADQAQIQRDWESDEAVKAYERQREFYQDFQSPQAQVQQYQEAGLNPALMFGRGVTPASPVSGNQASGGASAESVKPTPGDIGQLASLLSGIAFKAKEVNAEVKLKNAQTNEANARAENVRKENEVFGERFQLWKEVQNATVTNLNAQTAYELAHADLARANISKVQAETAWTKAQTILTKIDSQNRQAVIDSALAVNQANIALMTEQTAKTGSERRLVEQAYSQRMQKFEYELRQAAAEAGISENEFNAFGLERNLMPLLFRLRLLVQLRVVLVFCLVLSIIQEQILLILLVLILLAR